MKRNIDLIREILLQLEEDRLPYQSGPIGDWDIESVIYHKGLIFEAELAHGVNASTMEGRDFCLTRLTNKGHDFIESARSKKIWDQAKGKLSEIGGVASLSVINELLKQLVKDHLGIH